ncbi:hypothetical protein QOZ80_1AG0040550 [Eleusine coracana subsp. coracana]|nr:hypothetical protein QOZ80_1AG0040550 [Eleusine coracana subsp. coracana]
MDALPNTAEAPPGPGEDAKDGVEVCLFDESADAFSRTVRAITELTAGEPELEFPEAEVERIASSITFLREWRHFSYDSKVVSFTDDTESASSRNDMHNITLPQFSSASVPQITQQEDQKDKMVSFDFALFAGGNVWALDWCPRLSNKPGSSINCEHLAVSAHPPGSSYHKLGMPLTGRGIIQVWCLVAPFGDESSCQSFDAHNKSSRRGRPRKMPDGNNSVGTSSNPPKPRGRPRKIPDGNNPDGSSSNPPKPRGRPRKIPDGNNSVGSPSKTPKPRGRPRKRPIDLSEPVPKRPRGRPRKQPLPLAIVEDSSLNSGSQDIVLYDPLSASTDFPDDLPLAYVISSAKSVKSTPGRGRGRPRKSQTDKVTSSSGTTLTEDVCTALSPTIATCMEQKRRGRPRKCPVTSSIRSISSTEIESWKDITCQPVDHSACTESDANPSINAVDAALPIRYSSTATCESMSKDERGRRQNEEEPISNSLSCAVVPCLESCSKRETISNDPMVSVQNALPSGRSNVASATGQVCSVAALSCQGSVHNGVLSDDSVLPNHISSGKRGKGRARKNQVSAATSLSGVSGGITPKTASVQSDSDKHTALDKSGGKVIASNLDSISSCEFDIEKCSIDLNAALADAASPAHSIHDAECKQESRTKRGRGGSRKKHVSTEHGVSTDLNDAEPRTPTTPKSNGVALVESCVEGSRPRKGSRQHKKLSVSSKNSSTSICIAADAIVRPSTSMTMQASRSDKMANEDGLSGLKNEIVGCQVKKVNEKDTGNDTSHCNTENAQANEVAPIYKNNGIDGVKAAELVLVEEPREDENKFSSIENSNSSPIPKDIALPRVVLCLAHNGKVAWDIKWKPPVPNQPEQESCLGFLAVLLGNGVLEVWEVPSPRMIQKIYSPSMVEGSDPRFLKLQPVFRCAKVTCGNRQSIPLTVDWSPSPPHDMILAGCHDGTVAVWKFTTHFSSQDSKPFMCVTVDSVPIRALSWAPYISDENINTFVTAGEDGLKFWDLRDPYRPLWELTTAPRAVLSLHWLKDARGIVISLEDGTLKFLSLPRIANDVPVTGRPFAGTKTQGVSTYQLSEYLIWSVHASEITGYAAYCGADGTAVHFQLTSRFWEKEPGRNRAPYFLCGSLSEEGGNIKIGRNSRESPLPNVPLGAKKGLKLCQDAEKDKPQNITDSGDFLPLAASCENPELGDGQEDGHGEEQGAGAIVLAGPTEQENDGLWNSKAGESPKDFEVFPLPNLLHCIECDGTLTKVARDGYATEVLQASYGVRGSEKT